MILRLQFRLHLIVIALASAVLVSAAGAQTPPDFPAKSIGGMAKKTDALLRKPEARLIHHLATAPSGSGGVTFSGLMFSSFDVFSIRSNPEGSLLTVAVYKCEQPRGSTKVTRRLSLEIPGIDPNQFKSVVASSHEGLTNAIPGGSWVVVESTQQLKATLHLRNGKKPIVLPRFGFGFTTRSAANAVEKCLKDIWTRAKFEAKVKKAPQLTSFSERSKLYEEIHEALQDQGTQVGFFGAASSVTDLFHWAYKNDQHLRDKALIKDNESLASLAEITAFTEVARGFMNVLSQRLSKINVDPALELLRTGALKSGATRLTDRESIDKELVRREQDFAEKSLSEFNQVARATIISDVNRSLNSAIEIAISLRGTFTFKSLTAIRMVYEEKRAANPGALLDYGSRSERVKIGEMTAQMYR